MTLVSLGSVLMGLGTREDLATVVVKDMVRVFFLHDEAVFIYYLMMREHLWRIGWLNFANLVV